MIDRVFAWVDRRLHVAQFTRSALNKIFPDNWSFMLGEIALYCFVILVLTGVYLTFFFTPSAREVVYHGSERLDALVLRRRYVAALGDRKKLRGD